MEPKPRKWTAVGQWFARAQRAAVARLVARPTLALAVAVLVLACFVGVVGGGIAVWQSGLTLDQKLVALGDAFTIGAFTLAVIGAVIALLAYRLAIQRPKLLVHVKADDIPLGGTDELQGIDVVLARPDESGERRVVRIVMSLRYTPTNLPLHISVENTSDWSARNVAVRVDFKGIRRVPHAGGWVVAAYHRFARSEITALQWEGGADYAIHGHWARDLPTLYLNDALLEAPGDDCAMVVDIVAEGFHKAWTYPIRWQSQADDIRDRSGGAISGFTGYPSSGVPPLNIYAVPVDSEDVPWRDNIVVGYGYRWFWFDDLAPGKYHVLAYRDGYEGVVGAYTVGSREHNLTATMDHTLVAVEVKRGEVTDGVRITDWYFDGFPPEPARSFGYKGDQRVMFTRPSSR
jgi:hypothetical protein